MQKITPFIWFQGQAEEAMNFYTSVFPNSRITHLERYTGDMGIPDEEKLTGKGKSILKECEEPRTRTHLRTNFQFNSDQALNHHLKPLLAADLLRQKIDEDNTILLLAQRFACLRARIIKLNRLPNND